MASQVITPTSVIHEHPVHGKKELKVRSDEPVLDQEGNILPYAAYKVDTMDKYGQISPIPRLAAVAALGGEIPTAGGYGIDHVKDPHPDLEIPPECFLYDEDRPWVLGKLNAEALDLPEPAEPIALPQHVLQKLDALEIAANNAIRKRMEEEAAAEKAMDEASGNATVDQQNNVTVTENVKEKKEVAEKSVAEKVNVTAKPVNVEATAKPVKVETVAKPVKTDAAVKPVAKPKSRTSSVSPGKGLVRASPVRNSSPSPRGVSDKSTGATRPKTPAKSPARGVSPQAKIVSSAGPKKIVNAKVDLEIVEKKN